MNYATEKNNLEKTYKKGKNEVKIYWNPTANNKSNACNEKNMLLFKNYVIEQATWKHSLRSRETICVCVYIDAVLHCARINLQEKLISFSHVIASLV